MTVSLGKNLSSLSAQRQLRLTSANLSSSYERLSSGLRINRASDDAAGLSLASSLKMRGQVYSQAIRNVNDGISMLSIADQALNNLTSIVTRQRELAEQASNGTVDSSQRAVLDEEAQALADEYQRILDSTSYNGIDIFEGSSMSVRLQSGIGADGQIDAAYLQEITTSETTYEDAGTTTDEIKAYNFTGGLLEDGIIVADFNDDGYDDVVGVTLSESKTLDPQVGVRIYLGNEDGVSFLNGAENVLADFTIDLNAPRTAQYLYAEVYDHGSDGDLDIVVSAMAESGIDGQLFEHELFENLLIDNGTWSMDMANNDSVSTASSTLLTGWNPNVGDFNGDSFNDDIQVNATSFTMMVTDVNEIVTVTTQIDDLSQDSFSLKTQELSLSALTAFEALQDRISTTRGVVGASESRITHASNLLSNSVEGLRSAESRIMDVDMAQETARMLKNSILQETGTAILAQANLQPEIALSLLEAA